MLKETVKISNKLGLHARAASKFITLAAKFSSALTVRLNDKSIDGKSIMAVMTLAATQGSELELVAEGDDEKELMQAMVDLIQRKFDEE